MSFFKHPIGRRIPSILSSIAGPVTRQGNCKLYRITIAPPRKIKNSFRVLKTRLEARPVSLLKRVDTRTLPGLSSPYSCCGEGRQQYSTPGYWPIN